MGSQVCLLLSILYGNVLSKVAVSIDRALLSRDAQEYYMEEGSREEFRRLLPEHLRTMGPIVDVQELHAVEMLKKEAESFAFTSDEQLRQDAGGRWSTQPHFY